MLTLWIVVAVVDLLLRRRLLLLGAVSLRWDDWLASVGRHAVVLHLLLLGVVLLHGLAILLLRWLELLPVHWELLGDLEDVDVLFVVHGLHNQIH